MKNLLLVITMIACVSASNAAFDPKGYFDYLKTHKDMTYEQLLVEYPAGYFIKRNNIKFPIFQYADSIAQKYKLTKDELSQINQQGFMVTERVSYPNYLSAFYDIWQKDLPVYISTDALLHSLHYSFDRIMMDIEATKEEWGLDPSPQSLVNQVNFLIESMWKQIPSLEKLSDNSIYLRSLKDFDLYLTVARKLGDYNGYGIIPYFNSNIVLFEELISQIQSQQYQTVNLFAENGREYDFSQFTVRGHYTKNYYLEHYFKMMIWLGRTELYIEKPYSENEECKVSDDDVNRQLLIISFMADAIKNGKLINQYNLIQDLLTFLIGEQNGCSVNDVIICRDKIGVKNSLDLIDYGLRFQFQKELSSLNSSKQLYQSQILGTYPDNLNQVKPASVFLLIGQRPIIDGFITANLVYDRVIYQNKKQLRMLPNSLDVLFSLGNDASIQLLSNEINTFNYSTNLAACRYLVSSLDSNYWNESFYTSWLNTIRILNPPSDRSKLPVFMQTAAWQQKNMTTQLASWAELRHDFILYAMQPYTASVYTCSNPDFIIEPNQEFYHNLLLLSQKGIDISKKFNLDPNIKSYFYKMKSVYQTLDGICNKIISNSTLTLSETNFGKSIVQSSIINGCAPTTVLDGWYFSLFYDTQLSISNLNRVQTNIVADIHTSPTDSIGIPVGWVKHIGTGAVNLAVIGTKNYNGAPVAFAGPVYSFYEYTTSNFKRLTDEEWLDMFKQKLPLKPVFTNLYLNDLNGKHGGDQLSLWAKIEGVENEKLVVSVNPIVVCYPNPFSTSFKIAFQIPLQFSGNNCTITVVDIQGNTVANLLSENMNSGNYIINWDLSKTNINSGSYFISFNIGNFIKTEKVQFVK
ncbi:MAG: DUF3160 domain-containing protein [Candidatus Kapabacteria bacterium]|nr:DUF3160 domain-containing protein [Candidatus Kapabacteria bacterium]